MKDYKIGDIFYDDDEYSSRANFCNENNLMIAEIEPDEKGRRFQIQAIPEPTEKELLNNLRIRREAECFSIINRGELWYDTLTNEEKEELKLWYKAWLDVPQNYTENIDLNDIIPIKPIWLK